VSWLGLHYDNPSLTQLCILLEDHNYVKQPFTRVLGVCFKDDRWYESGLNESFKKSHCADITYFLNFMLWLVLYLQRDGDVIICFLAFYKIAHLKNHVYLCLPPSKSLYSAVVMFVFLWIEERVISFFVFFLSFSSISKRSRRVWFWYLDIISVNPANDL